MKLGVGFWTCAGVLMVAGAATAGPTWKLSEDSSMKLSFLGQVHFKHEPDAVQENDFYLRRGRFVLSGQIMDGVTFFVETDNDNAGKHGADVSTDIQDAFVDVRLLDTDVGEHWLQAGLILLPFSFENRSSAASLLGIDYNSAVIKFVNAFVWRDYGAMLHGNIGDRVSYCAGLFDGYDAKGSTKNPDAELRFAGHVAVNMIGKAETGWFYGQNRMPKESYVSLGAGVDLQNKATLIVPATAEGAEPAPGVVTDSENYVLDLQSGLVFSDRISLTLNAAYYLWDNAAFKGDTASAETGLLIDKAMVTLKCELQDPDAGGRMQDYTAGLHYFLKGHNARAGAEYRWGDHDDQVLVGLQFLL